MKHDMNAFYLERYGQLRVEYSKTMKEMLEKGGFDDPLLTMKATEIRELTKHYANLILKGKSHA